MVYRNFLYGFLIGVMLALTSCAAQLDYEKKINSPRGQAVEESIDLSLVNLFALENGQRLSVGQYMDEQGLDHLLLFFGSKGCGICTEKAVELRDRYLGRHSLWQGNEASRIQVIGVSTDAMNARGLVQRFALQNSFTHYRWIDPQGAAMLQWFLPADHSVGVPFTVMLSRAGILWRVTADDKAGSSLESLLNRAYASSRQTSAPQTPPLHTDPVEEDRQAPPASDQNDEPTKPDGRLAIPSADRLRGQSVKSCVLGTSRDLHSLLGDADFRLVQVFPKSCDSTCRQSYAELRAGAESCSHDGGCATASLIVDSLASCPAGMYSGGQPFLDAFASLFDWQHEVTVDEDWNFVLEGFSEPLLFIFDRDGSLVHTEVGPLSRARVEAILGADELPEIARSFDLPVYANGTAIGFADLRRQSDFTIVLGFERFCVSCQHEMAVFNRPGQLADYCAARPDTCQLYAMENTERDDYAGWDATVNASLAASHSFQEAGISANRIPLIFDLSLGDDPDTAYLQRYYTGYLAARFPAFDRGWGGIVVYNQEGRLVGRIDPADTFMGEQPDPEAAFATIRSWIEEDGGGGL